MLIDTLNLPGDLRKISYKELLDVCEETRNFLINTLADTGGHLASGLGTVELTVGLHAVYNTPVDKIIWDVGHQCYPHKILTGRKDKLHTIRKFGGLSPFLKRSESVYDEYGAGHASTAISAALGIAEARDLKGEDFSVAAVIGDASLSGGLAFEGINNAKNIKNNFTIILNDNDMSISKPVGAISTAITKMRLNPKYKVFRQLMEKMVSKVPAIGEPLVERVETAAELFRDFFFTETEETAVIFEELGFRYFGPIDGHDLGLIIAALKYAKEAKGPVLLHFITQNSKFLNICLSLFYAKATFR
jgi:1-deoxy-D-xylulose-5-phosphate synthase